MTREADPIILTVSNICCQLGSGEKYGKNPPKIAKRILSFFEFIVHCRECLGISYLSGSNPYMVWLFVQPEGFRVRYSIQVWAAVSHAKSPVNHHPGTPMLIALQQFWLKPLPLVWPISTSWPATTRIGRDGDCVRVLTANKWARMVLQLVNLCSNVGLNEFPHPNWWQPFKWIRSDISHRCWAFRR